MPRLRRILHLTLWPPHFQRAGAGSDESSNGDVSMVTRVPAEYIWGEGGWLALSDIMSKREHILSAWNCITRGRTRKSYNNERENGTHVPTVGIGHGHSGSREPQYASNIGTCQLNKHSAAWQARQYKRNYSTNCKMSATHANECVTCKMSQRECKCTLSRKAPTGYSRCKMSRQNAR